ncbi:MAG TPA: DUF3592 domain-containing protein [Terriglobales bacterium]|nr:DUF3592 domain-containing protein [Terriglobales bacterium]
MPASNTRWIGWLALWVILAVVFGAGFARVNWTRYYALSRRGVSAEALVVAKEAHQEVRYRFSVAGQTFDRIGHLGTGNPPYASVAVGQTINVYYLPTDPNVSCAGSPESWLNRETRLIVLLVAFAPIFVVFTIQWWVKRMQVKSAEELHPS